MGGRGRPTRSGRRAARTLSCAASLLASCGGEAPTTTIVELCRAVPARMLWDGAPTSCEHGTTGEGFRVACRNTRMNMEWVYPSLAAYVEERVVPGRTRIREFTSGGCGSFAFQGCFSSTLSYEHDATGRLQRRRWTSSNSFSPASEFQAVTFTAWDSLDRPTRAVWSEAGIQADVTIAYGVSGRETWSNGEERVRDGDGNLVRDVTVFRRGSELVRRDYDFVIEAAEPVCRDR